MENRTSNFYSILQKELKHIEFSALSRNDRGSLNESWHEKLEDVGLASRI